MKDRNGLAVSIGSRAFVLPWSEGGRNGGQGWVRAFSEASHPLGLRARIDNGNKEGRGDAFTWSAWVTPLEFEVLA